MRFSSAFSLLLAALCAACSPQRGSELDLVVAPRPGDLLEVTVMNNSGRTIALPQHLVVSGLGGGDLVAVIISEDGRLRPSCAVIDVFDTNRAQVKIPPGHAHVGWRGPVKLLKQWHCVEPGQYSVAFALVLSNEVAAISKPFQMRVATNGVATFIGDVIP